MTDREDAGSFLGHLVRACNGENEIKVSNDEPYNTMTQIANLTARRMASGDTDGMGAFFALVEDELATSRAMRNLLVVGLLEDLKNASTRRGVPLAKWEHWLGSATLVGWRAIVQLWSGEISAAQFNQIVDG